VLKQTTQPNKNQKMKTEIQTLTLKNGTTVRAIDSFFAEPKSHGECCTMCGRKMSDKNSSSFYLHATHTGYFIANFDDQISESQGCFAIGPECAKKLPADFVKTLTRNTNGTLS
jgi:hypothetical protein